MNRNYFVYDGVPSTDFGVYISGHDTFDSSVRDYSFITVSGKHGDEIGIEGRLPNIDLIYDAFIIRDFEENFAKLRNFLLSRFGYKRLTDTYHPNEYRLGVLDTPIRPVMTSDNRMGSFQLGFKVKPQRYLLSGEDTITFTASGALNNPTYFASKPMLRVYGTGQFYIGGVSVTIDTADGYTDLDCEVMEALKDGLSCNRNIHLEPNNFPELAPGNNNITIVDNTITRIDITPRWFVV